MAEVVVRRRGVLAAVAEAGIKVVVAVEATVAVEVATTAVAEAGGMAAINRDSRAS
jgi:hypothetical protein